MSERIGKLTRKIIRVTGERTPRRLRREVAALSHRARGLIVAGWRRDLKKAGV